MALGNNEPTNDSLPLDVPIALLYDFATIAGTAQDIQSLMSHFFNLLRTELEFDMAAYMVDYDGRSEGRVFSKSFIDKAKVQDFSGVFLKRASNYFESTISSKLPGLEHSILVEREGESERRKSQRIAQVYYHEIPLRCWGDKSTIITLVSYGSDDPFEEKSNLINAIADHAAKVLERLISNRLKEEKKLTNILFTMSEGIFIIDPGGYLTAVNPKSLEIISSFCKRHIKCIKRDYGLGRRLPKPDSSCEFTDLLSRAAPLLEAPVSKSQTEEITNEDGRILSIYISPISLESAAGSGLVLRAKDITEERLTQKGILLSSKLASLGEMAAGIAHEINNPLQTILGNLEMLEVNLDTEELERLDRVKNGVLRIRSTVKDLLMFAREQTTETESVDINDVIEKAIDIMHHHVSRAGLEVKTDLDTKPLTVKCNKNLLQQVIINLLQNAKDAIEESNKGTFITVRTALLPGKEVRIEVEDNGPGIPEAIIDKVFDPLFTTKEVGKGTGLGLSLSKKIVKGFGGSIEVKSSRKAGTRFSITLPHHGKVMGGGDLRSETGPDYSSLVDKTVLMVDDEEEILSTTRAAVAKNVFTIDTVSSGNEALNRIKRRDYDFIFLDIRMPQMDGIRLYRNMISLKPYLADRTIFLTGDVDNKKTAEFLRLTRSRYLAKPFSMKALLGAMCDIVKSAATTEARGG